MAFTKLILIAAMFMSGSVSAQAPGPFAPDTQAPQNVEGYNLVWNDEFNIDGKPDARNWIYEQGFVRNEELQWYQPANATCVNGTLVIEGRKETTKNPRYKEGSGDWRTSREAAHYTSASIQTRGLHQWKYGRFEIRARIDTAKGSWPAIWTLGTEKPWPSNGEIDIMEFYRVHEQPTILANTAWGTDRPLVAKWHTERRNLSGFQSADKDWARKFHTWRMDWNKDSISLFLDDSLLNTTLLSQTINADGSNPFMQPHYLLLNLAIGGNGGDPAATPFPLKYEVDYVRVCQKK